MLGHHSRSMNRRKISCLREKIKTTYIGRPIGSRKSFTFTLDDRVSLSASTRHSLFFFSFRYTAHVFSSRVELLCSRKEVRDQFTKDREYPVKLKLESDVSSIPCFPTFLSYRKHSFTILISFFNILLIFLLTRILQQFISTVIYISD